VKYISLGNLCLDRLVFRELIQEDFTAPAVADEVRRLVADIPYREKMLSGYAEIKESLGGRGASRAVAASMIQTLKEIS
jgi:lipid-A-disaccharide synthase